MTLHESGLFARDISAKIKTDGATLATRWPALITELTCRRNVDSTFRFVIRFETLWSNLTFRFLRIREYGFISSRSKTIARVYFTRMRFLRRKAESNFV